AARFPDVEGREVTMAVVYCPDCHRRIDLTPEEYSSGLIECMGCKRLFFTVDYEESQPSYPKRTSAHLFIAIAAVVGAVLLFLGGYVVARINNNGIVPTPKHGKSGPPKPDHSISAQSLFEQYLAHPALADKLYLGKTIDVSGQVVRVKQDAKGRS